jgi:hypothetical protein
VVDETQDAIGQRQAATGRIGGQEVLQATLHLGGGLGAGVGVGGHRSGPGRHSGDTGRVIGGHLREATPVPSPPTPALPTLGNRSRYTWFIMTISLSKVPDVRPGLQGTPGLVTRDEGPETEGWGSRGGEAEEQGAAPGVRGRGSEVGAPEAAGAGPQAG